MNNPNS